MNLVTTRVDYIPGAGAKLSSNRLLSLYKVAPEQEITLDEFETYALDR